MGKNDWRRIVLFESRSDGGELVKTIVALVVAVIVICLDLPRRAPNHRGCMRALAAAKRL